jgi:hypothetical protein
MHSRASTVKHIHGWMPTYAILCRQGRSNTSICLCCNLQVETASHVFKCHAPQAIQQCSSHLATFLSSLIKLKIPVQVIATLEYKLSLFFALPFEQTYFATTEASTSHHYDLLIAIRHQNLTGWDNFMRGYISTYWLAYIHLLHPNIPPTWEISIIGHIFNLTTAIWKDRNRFLHGNTKKAAAELLRECIVQEVKELHYNPPILRKRYKKITLIPLNDGISHGTTYLQRRLASAQHQKQLTKHIAELAPCKQPTIHQAFLRAQVTKEVSVKYPP